MYAGSWGSAPNPSDSIDIYRVSLCWGCRIKDDSFSAGTNWGLFVHQGQKCKLSCLTSVVEEGRASVSTCTLPSRKAFTDCIIVICELFSPVEQSTHFSLPSSPKVRNHLYSTPHLSPFLCFQSAPSLLRPHHGLNTDHAAQHDPLLTRLRLQKIRRLR